MKKMSLSFLLVLLLLGLLAGCGGETGKPSDPKGGTLYVEADAIIAIAYDEKGNVVSVTADSENAQKIVDGYQDYDGKPCSQVVSEIVEKVGQAGYLTEQADIKVTFEEGSGVPREDFVETLEQQIQDAAQKNGWEGTIQIEPPAISAPDSQPDRDPAEPSIPEGAQAQANGTYILTEYFNKGGKKVDSEDAAHSICVTVYNGEGNPISKEKTEKKSGQLRQKLAWEYDQRGLCCSYFCVEYSSNGVMLEHYREEYDEHGRVIRKNNLEKDGTVFSVISYSYYENGKLKLEEEISSEGHTLTKKEYAQSGVLRLEAKFFDNGARQSLLEYSEEGVLLTKTRWFSDGIMQYYEEFYPNGYSKTHKSWNGIGILNREFVSFHDGNSQNGILTEYDDEGNMTSRTTEGNPDGSMATWEMWYEENGGEYVVNVYDAPYLVELDEEGNPVSEARVVEERYTLSDGSYHNHTYDYTNGTMHTVGYWVSSNSKRDMISTIATDKPVEGYYEHTIGGIYRREEWKDGKRILEITDGGKVRGYTVKDTVTYHPNGQVKSSERYYYADGGHLYYEYDENGNLTYSEETTKYGP